MRSLTSLLLSLFLFTPACFLARQMSHSSQAPLVSASRLRQDRVKAEVPHSCPVTRPPAHPFAPPAPYSSKISPDGFWFGTNELWTSLPVDGTWSGLPHYTPTDTTFRQKLFFWRQGYDPRKDPQPNLVVTGKRLDSPAPPLLCDKANNGADGIVTGINLPTLGCWAIKAHYRDGELAFVVWVKQ
jgi:hypothetical protein